MNKEIIDNALKFITPHKEDKDERQQAQMWIRDFLEILIYLFKKLILDLNGELILMVHKNMGSFAKWIIIN